MSASGASPTGARLGIIGCGRVVEDAHAPALTALGKRVEIVALADASPERTAAVAAALPERTPACFTDWNEMLRECELDAVIIALPHDLHAPAISDAAAAGIDVICEKPLGVTLEEVDEIGTLVQRAGVRLAVIHNRRYGPEPSAAIQAVAEGRIGEVFLVRNEALWSGSFVSRDPSAPSWRTDLARSGGGIVIDSLYHPFYVSEAEANSPITSVYASLGSFAEPRTIDDTAIVVLRHESRATSVLQHSWATKGGGVGVHEIHGTEGSIRFWMRPAEDLSRAFRDERAAVATIQSAPSALGVEILDVQSGTWVPLLEGEPRPPWSAMIDVFSGTLDAWSAGEDAPVGLAEARRCSALVSAAYLSADRGEAVEVAEVERVGG